MKKMKRIYLLSTFALMLCSVMIWSCSQEETENIGKVYRYSPEEIETIEKMKINYGIDINIPYTSNKSELPNLESVDELFKIISGLQQAMKRVEITSDTTATLTPNYIKRSLSPTPEVYVGSYEDVFVNGYATFYIDFSWEKIHPTRTYGTFRADVKHVHMNSNYYNFTYCNLSSFKWVSSEFITYTLNCRLTSKNNFNVYVDFTLNGEINIPHNSTMVPL